MMDVGQVDCATQPQVPRGVTHGIGTGVALKAVAGAVDVANINPDYPYPSGCREKLPAPAPTSVRDKS